MAINGEKAFALQLAIKHYEGNGVAATHSLIKMAGEFVEFIHTDDEPEEGKTDQPETGIEHHLVQIEKRKEEEKKTPLSPGQLSFNDEPYKPCGRCDVPMANHNPSDHPFEEKKQ
jgi:hypothetical protein